VKFLYFSFILALWLISCDSNPFHQDKVSRPLQNQAPETYLFLFPAADSGSGPGIDTTASRQIIHWWGEDKDGQVVGYYYQWNYQSDPVWTTSEFDTFFVPIRSSYDEFSFRVWAVDNDSLMDPTPAFQIFPVFNSFPSISFKNRSNPPAPASTPNVTAYTFPTRTFTWDVEDPDGMETVTKIFYAVDDTSVWNELPGSERSITLTGLTPGEHRFFLKCADIAGAGSNIVSFPDPDDDMVPNHWVVKEPKGNVLLVNDYALDQNTHEVQSIYEDLLKEVVGENGYSVWEIGTLSTPQINPQNSLPYATADVKATLNYFDKVIWFSHLGRPNLIEASLSLTQYISEGGHVFITNGNSQIPDTTWTFTDIDTVFRLNPDGRLFPNVKVLASFTGTEVDKSLDLIVGQLIANRVSALIPGSGADIVYRMEPDTATSVPVPYTGSPAVGIRYEVGAGKSIYFSLPLHYCFGADNLTEVIRYILEDEFM
jgi:hypothetical protein